MDNEPNQNPYITPKAPLEKKAENEKGSGVKAVIVGFVADIVGSMIVGSIITFVWGVYLAMEGMSAEGMEIYFATSTAYSLAALAYGSVFTAVGGYIAAAIANHDEYKYAFLVGLCSLIFGEIVISMSKDYPIWLRIAGDMIVIPVALYGGHLRARMNRRAAST